MSAKLKLSTNHISLKVKNLQESFRFYHEILQRPIVRIVGPKDNPRIIWLQGIEITQIRPDDKRVLPSKTGFFGHIGFEAENIEVWIKRLEAEGVQFTRRFGDIKFEEEKLCLKLSFFLDPDGISCELVEWRNL
jgi:lactoylglutathione lyase